MEAESGENWEGATGSELESFSLHETVRTAAHTGKEGE